MFDPLMPLLIPALPSEIHSSDIVNASFESVGPMPSMAVVCCSV